MTILLPHPSHIPSNPPNGGWSIVIRQISVPSPKFEIPPDGTPKIKRSSTEGFKPRCRLSNSKIHRDYPPLSSMMLQSPYQWNYLWKKKQKTSTNHPRNRWRNPMDVLRFSVPVFHVRRIQSSMEFPGPDLMRQVLSRSRRLGGLKSTADFL